MENQKFLSGEKTGPNQKGGGYIWHTTGSGKTLTSFKAARLATQLEFIDKVSLSLTVKIWTIKQ